MTTTITKQDVYECTTNPCHYFLNGYAITDWVVMDGGMGIITDEAQQYLAWPCVVETEPAPTEEVHVTALQVGDRVSMAHLSEVIPSCPSIEDAVNGSVEGMLLEVRHGQEYYFVCLPTAFCIHGDDGNFTWTKDAVGQVLSEEYCFCNY